MNDLVPDPDGTHDGTHAGARSHGRRSAHDWRCGRDLRIRLLIEAGDPADPPLDLLASIARRIAEHCGHNPLKAHRLARGLTVEQAVAAVHRLCREHGLGHRGLTDRSWKQWEAGERPNHDYEDLVCRVFRTGPVALGFTTDYTPEPGGTGPAPGGALPVPCGPTVGSSLSVPGRPHVPPHTATRVGWVDDRVERWITMAAHESAQFGDHPSNVGPLTSERLRDDARDLAGRFANAPRLTLFQSALSLRDRVFGLLDGRQRVAESRELYFLGAVALGMLAEVNDDLGFRSQAMTHARTGLLCAREAGHPALIAWLIGEQSMISYWDGRPAQAADYARRGQEVATTGTVAVWLPGLEARAASSQGDASAAVDALERASTAREHARDDELDTDFGGLFTFLPAKQHHYTGCAWIALEDGPRGRSGAEAAIHGYQHGPSEQRARDNEAISQVNVATSYVLDDDLSGAQNALGPALDLPLELRVSHLGSVLRQLHARVSQARFHGSAEAAGIRDRIEDFLATGSHALPGD